MSEAQLEEAARLFGILSETSRLRLLRILMEGPRTVSELTEASGLKQGNVSKHLAVLLNDRFVARQRAGNFVRYRLADTHLHDLCELICIRIAENARKRGMELAGSRA